MEYQFNKFKPRKTTFLKVVTHRDWRIKLYVINEKVKIEDAAVIKILNHLPIPALTENRYGIGFLIIHQGVVANWFLLNWWGYEDIVHQKLFNSPVDDFAKIKKAEDRTIMACVHELTIYNFEMTAWKKWALSMDKPDFNKYLNEIID